MRALFGVVSLLVALAVVGLVVVNQLKAVGHVGTHAAAATPGVPAPPTMSGSGTVREQAVQLENKVANDVVKAMQQGAASRKEEPEK
jgi:hypothetical protein